MLLNCTDYVVEQGLVGEGGWGGGTVRVSVLGVWGPTI